MPSKVWTKFTYKLHFTSLNGQIRHPLPMFFREYQLVGIVQSDKGYNISHPDNATIGAYRIGKLNAILCAVCILLWISLASEFPKASMWTSDARSFCRSKGVFELQQPDKSCLPMKFARATVRLPTVNDACMSVASDKSTHRSSIRRVCWFTVSGDWRSRGTNALLKYTAFSAKISRVETKFLYIGSLFFCEFCGSAVDKQTTILC